VLNCDYSTISAALVIIVVFGQLVDDSEVEEKPSFTNPVPSFDNPWKPKLRHRTAETEPFSFVEERTQELKQRREEHVHSVIEEEQKVTFGN